MSPVKSMSARRAFAGDCLSVLFVALLAVGVFALLGGAEPSAVLWAVLGGLVVGLIQMTYVAITEYREAGHD